MSQGHEFSLTRLVTVLMERGWTPISEVGRMQTFAPPATLDLAPDFRLYLPRSDESKGGQDALSRVAESLSEIYGVASDEFASVLLDSDAVLAIQLVSTDFARGSVPLLKFESFIERLRRAILHTASFVLTSTPTIEEIPEEAKDYLARCRFLQTEHGSFVARIQLPERHPLSEATLFEEAVASADVSETLIGAIAFIANRVFVNDTTARSDESFEANIGTINVDLFTDIAEMFSKSGAESMNFTLTSSASERQVSSGKLSSDRLEMLDSFVRFAKTRLAADREIDVVGRIVELRSKRPDRRRNHVGISAVLDGEEVFISLSLGKNDYPYAIAAHNNNSSVRLRAAVRKLKTQLRVITLGSFEEIPTQPGG